MGACWKWIATCGVAATIACAPVGTLAGAGEPARIAGVRLNETAGRRPSVTPLAILEDSRCPSDVQCIQAGTVRIEARVATGRDATTLVLQLGEARRVGDIWVELVGVCPYPAAATPIAPSAYRFTFLIGEGPATPSRSNEFSCDRQPDLHRIR